MVTQTLPVTSTNEQDRAIAVITMAFSDDPVVRWAVREPHAYLTYFPRFVAAFAGGSFANGSAHSTDGLAAVALWLPPGLHSDDETMGALLDEAVPDADKDEVFGFMGQMGDYHPKEPHWYLPLIGVDPTKRGQGFGSALLRHALKICDEQGKLAYLEATSPRNKPLYERHGFEEIGVIQHGSSPPMWPMLRKPR